MIIDRRTFIIKRGHTDEAIAIIQEGKKYSPFVVPAHIYLPQIGPFDMGELDLEFKDLAEYEQFWNGMMANAPQEWWLRWENATESGGKCEIWRLAAQV